jgi:RHS repeat-associated protein
LPTGGGAIRSIGEKFEANPATGTASFTVPITISEGRDGFTPQLALNYDSGSGNSVFGLGWNIGLPNITRKTDKGLPQYGDNPDNETDTFILSGAEDLVPISWKNNETRDWRDETIGGKTYKVYSYQPRTEGLFASIERWVEQSEGDRYSHWRTVSKENITSVYGLIDRDDPEDKQNHCVIEDGKRIFSWLIKESWDAKGNLIRFTYKKEDGTKVKNSCFENHRLKNGVFSNTYLKKVEYGNKVMCEPTTTLSNYNSGFHFHLVFDYGDHDPEDTQVVPNQMWAARSDPFSNYKAGFEIRTYRRCKRILMFHNFEDSVLVRSTDLYYKQEEEERQDFSLLESITHCGYKDDVMETFPPLEFTYTEATPATSFKTVPESMLKQLPAGIDGTNYQWADLYSEGISGILNMTDNAWYFKPNLGDAKYTAPQAEHMPTFGNMRSEIPKPAAAKGKKTSYRLGDVDSDGFPELIVEGDGLNGFYSKDENGKWLNFRPFAQYPNVNTGDANLRFMDLSGNGLSDMVISKGDSFDIYFSEGKKGFGNFRRVRCGNSAGFAPQVLFSDAQKRIFLADMSGDGLTDIVKITHSSIVYWPNLGYGKFGEKIIMSNPPLLDSLDQFDARFVHLADVDGTGTTDLLYISKGKIRYYKNLSGNAWEEEALSDALSCTVTQQHFVQLTDLLGNGTQCVVVSSSLPAQAKKMRYWELTSGIKPFLLKEINNNMGGITKLHYCSSTKFYIQDKLGGKPWITKLPFPVHVLEKVETIDLVGNKHFTNCYAYHHGYFDPTEREFRGFGMVEQWDAECYAGNCDENSYGHTVLQSYGLNTPPVYTKTWFHTGYKSPHSPQSPYRKEYWGYNKDTDEQEKTWELPCATFLTDVSAQELREAYRALRGSILRTEVYAQDETDKEKTPYTVEEKSYHLQRLREKGKNKHAVFLKTDAESILYHFERNEEDPRILHKLVLKTDPDYGHELKTAEIAYPRQTSTLTEQKKILATYTENTYINIPEDKDTYSDFRLIGIPCEIKQYEIHNLTGSENPFTIDVLLDAIREKEPIDYADTPDNEEVQLRTIKHERTLFWNEDITAPLPFEKIAPHALPYQQQTLELTQELIDRFNKKGEKITETLLMNTCKYKKEGNNWFAVSDIQHFSTLPNSFYLPCKTTDPFDNETTIEYDDYSLFPVKVIAPLNMVTTAEYDYRVLQATKLTDPNLNSKKLEFNALGMVTKLALVGEHGEGDTLDDPTEEYRYYLHCWKTEKDPVCAFIKKRETHGDSNTRWIESYVYTDGLGNEIMTKTTAEDGKAWTLENGIKVPVETSERWLASGKVIYNNKGNAVKQYEPWYSITHEFTFEDELTHYGVTPLMHYDPLGRLIQTDFPDATTSRVEFDAWQQKNYDQNDCDDGSNSPNHQPSPHYNTPQVIDFDVLGRPFQTKDDNGTNGMPDYYRTHNTLDITGRILEMKDALDRVGATKNRYALSEKHLLYTRNIDSGKRWMLNDTAGKPVRKWDTREHEFQYGYDMLQRPTHTILTNYPTAPNAFITSQTIELTIYGNGEETQDNSIGQIIASYAQDGITYFEYDFKGNIIFLRKQFTQDYNMLTNWEDDVQLIDEVFVTQTEYDALNRPIAIVHPDESVVSYAYDKGGLLKKVLQDNTEHVTNITYNPKGQRENIYYGNNTKTRYYYKPENFRLERLLTTRNTGQDILQDLNYKYDATGNITKITDDAQQTHYFSNSVIAPVSTFEYDALYRLTKATGRELTSLTASGADDFANDIPVPNIDANAMQNYVHNYEYDKLGNMLSDAWKPYIYALENNYLLGHKSASQYTYDAHGNMLTMPHLSEMVWDYNDRLFSASNGTFFSYYNYDAEGNRTRKVVDNGNIIEERYYIGGYEVYRKHTNNLLTLERTTINISDDEKVFVRSETETGHSEILRFQFDNHLGSACLELDENGYIISYEEYHPFGTTSYRAGRSATEVSLKRYKYNGKERDEETGLYMYGMRYYAAWLCRFVSTDPLQHDYPNLSPYAYCDNNPVNLIDPTGMSPEDTPQNKSTFYNEKGKALGNVANSDDGKAYIVTNKDEIKAIKKAAKGGIDTDISGVKSAIELPDISIREEMVNTITNLDTTDPFREYGGLIGIDAEGNTKIVWAKAGEKSIPGSGNIATVSPYDSQNLSERDSLVTITGTFHSHPSGTKTTGNDLPNPGTISLTNNTTTDVFVQPVSEVDIANAKANENRSDQYQLKGNSYVLAMRDKKVHVYNSSGVKASISLYQFGRIGKK